VKTTCEHDWCELSFSSLLDGATMQLLQHYSNRLLAAEYVHQCETLTVCRLEVWPGFVTSILQFESSTMLIADVSHKILHFKTVLDTMYDIYNASRQAPNFKEIVAKQLIGQIVLTRCVSHQ